MSSFLDGLTKLFSAITIVMVGAAIGFLYDLNASTSRNTEKLAAMDGRFDRLERDVAALSGEISGAIAVVRGDIEAMSTKIDNVQKSIDLREVDLGKILTRMGTVGTEWTFHAAIYDEHVWIFPTSEDAIQSFARRGLEREAINTAVTGFKLVPVAAVTNQ